ncbi:hypothetical protein KKC59_03095, partial [bacterium]|nr:hypothetical protein [bacterium]
LDDVITWAKEIEYRAVVPELYTAFNTLKGRAKFAKEAEIDHGLNMSIKNKIRRFIESEHLHSYFGTMFILLIVLVSLYSLLIIATASIAGMMLVKFLFGWALIGVLAVLLMTNCDVFTNRLITQILKPPLNPAVETAYGHSAKAMFGAPMLPDYPGDKEKVAFSSEMKDRMILAGLQPLNAWWGAQRETAKNSPNSMIYTLPQAFQARLGMYELPHIFFLEYEVGEENIINLHRKGNWLAKPGVIMGMIDWVMGNETRREFYKQEGNAKMHLGLMKDNWPGGHTMDPNNPILISPMKYGGGRWNHTDPFDRIKREKLETMKEDAMSAYYVFMESGNFDKIQPSYSKHVAGENPINLPDSPITPVASDMYKNDGVGTHFISSDALKHIRFKNGNQGMSYVFNLDSDNILPKNVFSKVFAASMCRYNSRFVGIQQTRTTTANPEETVFAAKSSFAHDKLQFTQQGLWLGLGRYNYYGKGAWDLRPYYRRISRQEMIYQDAICHDMIEAIGGDEFGRLHRAYAVFNFEKSILEGAATNFPTATIRGFSRWLMGTMQSTRELFDSGPSAQKWITSLSIRGYWGEMFFLIYIMMGFLSVFFNLLLINTAIFFPTIIMLMFFLFSMFMIIVYTKFVGLNLIKGGAKKNFMLGLSELLISTTIFLNNMIPGTQGDIREINNIVQQKASGIGIAQNIPWLPSAIIENILIDPKPHDSFQQFRPQVKIGVFLLSLLFFSVLFLPVLGLVWSTVSMYLLWAFPVFFSFLTGWYFASKSGEFRGALAKGMEKVEKTSSHNTAIARARKHIWLNDVWDKTQNSVTWEKGVFEKFGREFRDFREYTSAMAKDEELGETTRKRIVDRTANRINKKIGNFVLAAGGIVTFISVVLFLNVLLLSGGLAVVAAMPAFMWVIIGLFVLGLISIVIGLIVKYSSKFDVLNFQKKDDEVKNNVIMSKAVMYGLLITGALLTVFALFILIGNAAGLAIAGVLYLHTVGWFTLIAGLIVTVLGLFAYRNSRTDRAKHAYFSKKDFTGFREYVKKRLWKNISDGLKKIEREEILKEFGGDTEKAKEQYYQYMAEIFAEKEANEDAEFLTGTGISISETKKSQYRQYLDNMKELQEDVLYPVEAWQRMKRACDLRGEDGNTIEINDVVSWIEKKYGLNKNEIQDNVDFKTLQKFAYYDLVKKYLSMRGDDENTVVKLDDLKNFIEGGKFNSAKASLYSLIVSLVNVDQESDEQRVKQIKEKLELFFTGIYGPKWEDVSDKLNPKNKFTQGIIKKNSFNMLLRNVRGITEFKNLFIDQDRGGELSKIFFELRENKKNDWIDLIKEFYRIEKSPAGIRRYREYFDEYAAEAIQKSFDIYWDKSWYERYRGTFGNVLYKEVRNDYYDNYSMQYLNTAFDKREALNKLLDKIDFVQEDGMLKMVWKDEKGGQDKQEFIKFFMDNLAELNTRRIVKGSGIMQTIRNTFNNFTLMEWKHGDNIRKQLWHLAGHNQDKMFEILADSGHIQAVVIAAKISADKNAGNNSDVSGRFKEYFKDVSKGGVKKKQYDLMTRFPNLLSAKILEEDKDKDYFVDFISSKSDAYYDNYRALFFYLRNAKDKKEFEGALNQILTYEFNIAKDAKLDYYEFLNFVNVLESALGDDLKEVEKRVIFKAMVDKKYTSLGARDRFTVDKLHFAKFSWVSGHRLPKAINAVTYFQIFKFVLKAAVFSILALLFVHGVFYILTNILTIAGSTMILVPGSWIFGLGLLVGFVVMCTVLGLLFGKQNQGRIDYSYKGEITGRFISMAVFAVIAALVGTLAGAFITSNLVALSFIMMAVFIAFILFNSFTVFTMKGFFQKRHIRKIRDLAAKEVNGKTVYDVLQGMRNFEGDDKKRIEDEKKKNPQNPMYTAGAKLADLDTKAPVLKETSLELERVTGVYNILKQALESETADAEVIQGIKAVIGKGLPQVSSDKNVLVEMRGDNPVFGKPVIEKVDAKEGDTKLTDLMLLGRLIHEYSAHAMSKTVEERTVETYENAAALLKKAKQTKDVAD